MIIEIFIVLALLVILGGLFILVSNLARRESSEYFDITKKRD